MGQSRSMIHLIETDRFDNTALVRAKDQVCKADISRSDMLYNPDPNISKTLEIQIYLNQKKKNCTQYIRGIAHFLMH